MADATVDGRILARSFPVIKALAIEGVIMPKQLEFDFGPEHRIPTDPAVKVADFLLTIQRIGEEFNRSPLAKLMRDFDAFCRRVELNLQQRAT